MLKGAVPSPARKILYVPVVGLAVSPLHLVSVPSSGFRDGVHVRQKITARFVDTTIYCEQTTTSSFIPEIGSRCACERVRKIYPIKQITI